MLTLLMYVLILGVVAWAIKALEIGEPFKTVAYAILIIILIVLMFQTVPNYLNLNLR